MLLLATLISVARANGSDFSATELWSCGVKNVTLPRSVFGFEKAAKVSRSSANTCCCPTLTKRKALGRGSNLNVSPGAVNWETAIKSNKGEKSRLVSTYGADVSSPISPGTSEKKPCVCGSSSSRLQL